MENIYDKALNCKFHGQIEKIKEDYGYLDCEISYIITAKYNNELYLLQGIGKNLDNKNPICTYERMYYAFSRNYPKVGDDLYVIAEGLSNDIKETGKNVYDANPDLNLCIQYPYSFMGGYIQERYEIMDMCKVSGKIESLLRTPESDNCGYNLNLKINHNNQVSYTYNTTEQLIDNDGNYCLGGEYMFSFTNPPKIGDNFYGVVSQKTNELLKVGKTRYDQYNQLSDCTGAVILSNNGETILNNSGNVISSNINEVQTGKILEKNISVQKKEIIISNEIVKSSSKQHIETIKNDNQISEILSGTLNTKTESNSGIIDLTGASNKPYKTETGVITKQENEMMNSTSSGINGFYIISIILISIISLIFINKRFKSL